MASSAQYASTPISKGVIVSTANTNRDGTGTVAVLLPVQASGCRIDDINVNAQVTTTGGMVRIFMRNGAIYYLLREIPVAATTASATVPAFSIQLLNLAWVIEPGWELVVSTEKAEAFAFLITRGGAL